MRIIDLLSRILRRGCSGFESLDGFGCPRLRPLPPGVPRGLPPPRPPRPGGDEAWWVWPRRTLIRERSQSLSAFFGTITETPRVIAPRALSPVMSSFTASKMFGFFWSVLPMLLDWSGMPSHPSSSCLTDCTRLALKFRFRMFDGLITSCVDACNIKLL